MSSNAQAFLNEAIEHSQKKTKPMHFCVKPKDYEKLDILCKHFEIKKVDWLEAMIKQSYNAYLEDK